MARCQRIDVIQQYNLGVRLFDCRVRIYNDTAYICHGLMEYHRGGGILNYLNDVGDTVYCRMVLEEKRPTAGQIEAFAYWCEAVEHDYPNIKFFGGNDRSDWGCQHPHYKFKTPLQDLDDKYSSTTTLFPKGFKWLRYIDDLCPVLYARLHNRGNIRRGTTHEWLFIDFVDIQ